MIDVETLEAIEAGMTVPDFSFYKHIPGWFDFQQIYWEAAHQAKEGDVMVEVGSLFGASIAFLADEIAAKNVEIHAIDTWAPLVSDEPLFNDIVKEAGGRYEAFEFFMERHGISDRVTVKRKDSVEALAEYDDGSIAFLFLDGAHDYSQVSAEIKLALKKVHKGGTLAGHDFNYDGVRQAVVEILGNRIEIVRGSRSVPSWRVVI